MGIKVCPGPAWGSIVAGLVAGGVAGAVLEVGEQKRNAAEHFDRLLAAGDVLKGDHAHPRPAADSELGMHLKQAHQARTIRPETSSKRELTTLHEYLHKPS